MRRLLAFFAVILVTLALVVAVEWRVDAFGDVFRGGALPAAERDGCVVSDDLIGPAGLWAFKDELVRRAQPREVVVGTSRALKMRARPGERGFVNYAVPGTRPDLRPVFRRLHELDRRPLTVLVSTEYFWFNRNWAWSGFVRVDDGFGATVKRLLTRQRLDATLARLRDDPGSILHRWTRVQAASTCALDSEGRLARGQVNAWRTDGSMRYAYELEPGRGVRPNGDYDRDFGGSGISGGGYYHDFRRLEPGALAQLDSSLALARSYGWRVVGYAPPYASRYVHRLSTVPETAASWKAFGPAMQRLFARHGFPFVDLRRGTTVCPDTAYVDDGWHPDDRCADAVRRRVESALR